MASKYEFSTEEEVNKGRFGKILRERLRCEQAVFLCQLRDLRWQYYCRYVEYLEGKGLDAHDFSFYEFLLREERRKNPR